MDSWRSGCVKAPGPGTSKPSTGVRVQSLPSCSTLCELGDYSLPTPLSMRFSRQEYWSGCHFLLQEILPIQGSNPRLLCLLHWQVGSLPPALLGKPTGGRRCPFPSRKAGGQVARWLCGQAVTALKELEAGSQVESTHITRWGNGGPEKLRQLPRPDSEMAFLPEAGVPGP